MNEAYFALPGLEHSSIGSNLEEFLEGMDAVTTMTED